MSDMSRNLSRPQARSRSGVEEAKKAICTVGVLSPVLCVAECNSRQRLDNVMSRGNPSPRCAWQINSRRFDQTLPDTAGTVRILAMKILMGICRK